MSRGIPFVGRLVLTVLVLGLVSRAAPAVIKADLPLAQVYKSADDIITAKVDAVDADKNVANLVEAVAFSELKSGLKVRDRTMVLQLDPDKKLAERLKKGDPVVVFVAKKGGAVHVGDAWYLADPTTGANWRLLNKQDLGQTYPGTTPGLIRALKLLRADKAPLLDAVMHHTWAGGFKLQKLDAVGKVMASADANGDNKADLLLVTEKVVRFYKGVGPDAPFVEDTEKAGLSGVAAQQVAFADVNGDGKPDLLLNELYLNDGGRFVRSKAGINLKDKAILAVALLDATGDGKPDALVLTRTGVLTVYENPGKDAPWPKKSEATIWKSGEPYSAHIGNWGDDGKAHIMAVQKAGPIRYSLSGETADFTRLTGIAEPKYSGKPRHFPLDDFRASVAWDRNGGDGHLDLLVSTRRGGAHDIELIGRGHGAFFYNTEGRISVTVKGARMGYTPATLALAPADMDGNGSAAMLILEENGDLWVNRSPYYARGSPLTPTEKK